MSVAAADAIPLADGLFVSDIDGTLVTPDKRLTPAALRAAVALAGAGVPFTVVSSRPPRGMASIVAELGVRLPFAGFNGGALVQPGGRVIEAWRLSAQAAARTLDLLAARSLGAWVFADDAWLIGDPEGPNIDRERRTVGFEPTVIGSFETVIDRIDKIVAVSDDYGALDAAEAALRQTLGADANIERSQPYYVDITHPRANKGDAVRSLAALAGADLARTVVIGDMTNDVAMFRVAGYSIAMGQSPAWVKQAAQAVTLSNTEEGFAEAVRRLVLPRFGARGAG